MTAEQTQLTAAQWLERRQDSDWSAEDQTALDAWLTDSGNRIAFLRIETAWQRAERLKVLRPPAQTPARAPMRAEKHPARSTVWPALRSVAAALVFAVLGAIAWQQFQTPSERTYVTAIGGHKVIGFEDGTRVELNTDTVLRVSSSRNERKAWLDKGEAYFEVEHDASRPFTVIAKGRKVTDLGTKFVVRQDTNELRVTVVEGLVEVEAKDEKPQSLLKPGYVLTATAQTQAVTQKPLQTIRATLDWKHGKLFFYHVTLAEAAAEFNRYNTRKLIITDPKAAKQTVVGTFQTRDLDAFTSVATDLFGLKAESRNDQIILSR